ncbi:MAG: ABC transporter permease [Methanobacteriota archaeon]
MPPAFVDSIWTVARKELLLHLKTKRLLVIGGVFAALIIIISLYGGYLTGQAQDEPTYEQGAGAVMSAVFSFSAFFPAILAVAMTYDAIVGEKVNHSMYLLISKPVRRESIFLGKLLGAWLAVALVYVVVFSLGFVLVLGMAGASPTADGAADVYGAVGIILLGTGAWMTLVMLYSSLFKTTASTLITAILSWLFVLSLVSQAGLIYYAVSISGEDVELNVNINYTPMPGNQTILTFSGFAMINAVSIDVSVSDAQGNPVLNELPGSDNTSHSFVVAPGTYVWSASREGDASGAFASGTVAVVPFASMSFGVAPLDDDMYANDVAFSLVDGMGEAFLGGEYSISDGGSPAFVQLEVTAFAEKNLTEGAFAAEVRVNGQTVLQSTFNSYGEKLSGNLAIFAALSGENDDAPGYVRAMYAINPDNCMGAYNYLFNPDYVGILTLGESIGSLTAFTITSMAIGLIIFKRKSLA